MDFCIKNDVQHLVRENYAKVATASIRCYCSIQGCCTASEAGKNAANISKRLGYSHEDVILVPDGSNMGLGCGNPHAIASLKKGEHVLDLGSGGGFDCFLAAKEVGVKGYVIGVDMTPEMIEKAKQMLKKSSFKNIEFRLGLLEKLPVEDDCIDVIISNCVINLSPDKTKVFQEAFRVLKKGGRIAISDIVATKTLPLKLQKNMSLYVGCMAGASSIEILEKALVEAGFKQICINLAPQSREFIRDWAPGSGIEKYVCSATIEALKQ